MENNIKKRNLYMGLRFLNGKKEVPLLALGGPKAGQNDVSTQKYYCLCAGEKHLHPLIIMV